MKIISKVAVMSGLLFSSVGYAGNWVEAYTHNLDGYANALPSGYAVHQECVPAGVYRFRVDPNSIGINYTGGLPNFKASKALGLFILNRADSTVSGQTYFYGLNASSTVEGLPSAVIHAAPGTVCMGYDAFIEDWNRADNSGSVTLIVEVWK